MIVNHYNTGRIFTRLDVPTQKIEVDLADVIGGDINRYNLLDWRVVVDTFEEIHDKATGRLVPENVRFVLGGNSIEMTPLQADHFRDTLYRLLNGLMEISDLAEDNKPIDETVNKTLEAAVNKELPAPPAALYEMHELVRPQTNLNGTDKNQLIIDLCNIMTVLREAASMIQSYMPHDRDYQHRNNGIAARDAYVERINILHDMKQQFEQLALDIQDGKWGDSETKRRFHGDNWENMKGKI